MRTCPLAPPTTLLAGMSAHKRPVDTLELAEPYIGAAKRGRHSVGQQPLTKSLSSPSGEFIKSPKSLHNSSYRAQLYHHHATMMITLQGAMKMLQACCAPLPQLQSTVEQLLETLDVIEIPKNYGRNAREMDSDLVQWIIVLSAYLDDINPERIPKEIEIICEGFRQEIERMHQVINQMEQASETESALDHFRQCFRRMEDAICRLQADQSLSSWRANDKNTKMSQIGRLLPATNACYNSTQSDSLHRRGCHPGTRALQIDNLIAWANGIGKENVFWMNGMAGTGKTTIAYSICNELDKRGQLAASFFCSRVFPACNDLNRIIPTIAYQIAQRHYPFRWALCRLLESSSDIYQFSLHRQFESLIATPFLEVKNLLPNEVVIIIDGLDECSHTEATGLMLDVLLSQDYQLLPVRIFLASRPGPRASQSPQSQRTEGINAHSLDRIEEKVVKNDIERYIRDSLAPIEPVAGASLDLSRLVELSGTLFLYASTAVKYIQQCAHVEMDTRLAYLYDTSQHRHEAESIDQLYKSILDTAFDIEGENKAKITDVISAVACAMEPLSCSTIAGLLGIERSVLGDALSPLTCVLGTTQDNQIVSVHHSSFHDFIRHQPSGSNWGDDSERNQYLAERCFDVMKRQLRFNICDLETSYYLDKQVPDLQSRIKTYIPEELSYACQYWIAHLTSSQPRNETWPYSCILDFLTDRLLFWMEVMNLKGLIHDGLKILMELRNWLENRVCPLGLREFLDDALGFVTTFATNPVHLSTPHLYISMLFLTPRQSRVWNTNGLRASRIIQAHSIYLPKNPSANEPAVHSNRDTVNTLPALDAQKYLSEVPRHKPVLHSEGETTRFGTHVNCPNGIKLDALIFDDNNVVIIPVPNYLIKQLHNSRTGSYPDWTPQPDFSAPHLAHLARLVHPTHVALPSMGILTISELDNATILTGSGNHGILPAGSPGRHHAITGSEYANCSPTVHSVAPSDGGCHTTKSQGLNTYSCRYQTPVSNPSHTKPYWRKNIEGRKEALSLIDEVNKWAQHSPNSLGTIMWHNEYVQPGAFVVNSPTLIPPPAFTSIFKDPLDSASPEVYDILGSKDNKTKLRNTKIEEINTQLLSDDQKVKLVVFPDNIKEFSHSGSPIDHTSYHDMLSFAAKNTNIGVESPDAVTRRCYGDRNPGTCLGETTVESHLIGRCPMIRACDHNLLTWNNPPFDGLTYTWPEWSVGAVGLGTFYNRVICTGSDCSNRTVHGYNPTTDTKDFKKHNVYNNRSGIIISLSGEGAQVSETHGDWSKQYKDGNRGVIPAISGSWSHLQHCNICSDARPTTISWGSHNKLADSLDSPDGSSSADNGNVYLQTNPMEREYSEWKMDEQGWIVDSSSHYLFWIPPTLRGESLSLQALGILSGAAINIKHSSAFIGESWKQCYERGA